MKDNLWIRNNHFTLLSYALMFITPIVFALIALCSGRMFMSVKEVVDTLMMVINGKGEENKQKGRGS